MARVTAARDWTLQVMLENGNAHAGNANTRNKTVASSEGDKLQAVAGKSLFKVNSVDARTAISRPQMCS